MLRSDFLMYHYTSPPAAWPKNSLSVLQKKREPDLRLRSKIHRITQVYSCSGSPSFLCQSFVLLLNETLMAGKGLSTFIPRAKQLSAKVSRKQKAEGDSSWPNLQVLGKARAILGKLHTDALSNSSFSQGMHYCLFQYQSHLTYFRGF